MIFYGIIICSHANIMAISGPINEDSSALFIFVVKRSIFVNNMAVRPRFLLHVYVFLSDGLCQQGFFRVTNSDQIIFNVGGDFCTEIIVQTKSACRSDLLHFSVRKLHENYNIYSIHIIKSKTKFSSGTYKQKRYKDAHQNLKPKTIGVLTSCFKFMLFWQSRTKCIMSKQFRGRAEQFRRVYPFKSCNRTFLADVKMHL